MARPVDADWESIKKRIQIDGLTQSAAAAEAGICHSTISRHMRRHQAWWSEDVGAGVTHQEPAHAPPVPVAPPPPPLTVGEEQILATHKADLHDLSTLLRANRAAISQLQTALLRIEDECQRALGEWERARDSGAAQASALEADSKRLERERGAVMGRVERLSRLATVIQRTASTLITAQDGERRTWGISDAGQRPVVQLLAIIQQISGRDRADNILSAIEAEADARGRPALQ